MSLSVALNTARSSLFATASQIETTARNIANAGQAGASRKIAVTATASGGGAYVVTVSRAADSALYTRMLSATSSSAAGAALLDGLDRMQATIGDPESDASPAARLGALGDALTRYANAPDEPSLGAAVVTSAKDIARTLNAAADAVQGVRQDADAGMVRSVARVNDLLRQFAVENATVIKGSATGIDVSDAMDRRDTLLASLTEEMGVTAITRSNSDMLIYTDSGATLFETTPRTVSLAATPVLAAGQPGAAVTVDGVSVTGADAAMPLRSGRSAGLATLRDSVAPTMEKQLDSIAQGLIAVFAETDRSGGAPAPGLFTAGGATVPTDPTGLARRIGVAAAVDTDRGGSPALLRDGGINGAAYRANASGYAGFADNLQAMGDRLAAVRTFDGATAVDPQASLGDFASASVGWLARQRQTTSTTADSEKALLAHASGALSNATGINMDDEYARQLELERSYQASSKLIAVVSGLFDVLLQATR